MADINRFYSASDFVIDALKQAGSSKSTKKSTLSWMRVLNNWKMTCSYTQKMYTYQPENLNLILDKLYAEQQKTIKTDSEPAFLRVMMSSLDR